MVPGTGSSFVLPSGPEGHLDVARQNSRKTLFVCILGDNLGEVNCESKIVSRQWGDNFCPKTSSPLGGKTVPVFGSGLVPEPPCLFRRIRTCMSSLSNRGSKKKSPKISRILALLLNGPKIARQTSHHELSAKRPKFSPTSASTGWAGTRILGRKGFPVAMGDSPSGPDLLESYCKCRKVRNSETNISDILRELHPKSLTLTSLHDNEGPLSLFKPFRCNRPIGKRDIL